MFSIVSHGIYSTYIFSQLYPMTYIPPLFSITYIYIYPMTFIPHLFSIISHDTYSTYCLNYIPWHIFDILSQLYPMMCIPHSTYLLNYIPWHTHIITYIYIYIYIDKHIPMTSPGFMLIYPHRSGQKPTPRSCRFPWSWWPWVKRSRLGSSGTSVQAGKSMGAVLQKDAGCNMWLQELWLLIVGSK